ncbi:hypothetical protein [Streptomyces sp. CS62]|uniref:hypothetical protein n=1 Tax=Streptomyces sp. CS62 TaxID=3119268 RepID=UPI002F92BE3C
MVGAVAGAAGQVASAAAQTVTATAGVAGKVVDAGKAGLNTATAGIKAVDNAAARSFAKNNQSDDSTN